MKSLYILNLTFTIMILVIGIVIYSNYHEYKPEVASKEDVANIIKEVDLYNDIKQLKARYINHVSKNYKNHQVVKGIIEFVIYLFAGMAAFLIFSLIILTRMELRRR